MQYKNSVIDFFFFPHYASDLPFLACQKHECIHKYYITSSYIMRLHKIVCSYEKCSESEALIWQSVIFKYTIFACFLWCSSVLISNDYHLVFFIPSMMNWIIFCCCLFHYSGPNQIHVSFSEGVIPFFRGTLVYKIASKQSNNATRVFKDFLIG